MRWVPLLLLAVALEVTATTCMKLSDGFKHLLPSGLMFLFYGLSFLCLTLLLKRVDVSVAYALWSAIGTAAIATIGMLFFKEPFSWLKVASIGLIIAGIVGLRLSHAG